MRSSDSEDENEPVAIRRPIIFRRRMNYTEIEWSYGYNWRFHFNFSESGRTRNEWTILHQETNQHSFV